MTVATTNQRYQALVKVLLRSAGVTQSSGEPSSRRGFGADALKINNRIFAMLSSRGRFVVKLPRARVDALVSAGEGERFDPGHGRLMKEWLSVNPGSEERWLALAKEAKEFVARSTPG